LLGSVVKIRVELKKSAEYVEELELSSCPVKTEVDRVWTSSG
jgi:hypothetical protein